MPQSKSAQIIEAIDRWARGGIFIQPTTLRAGKSLFYIAKWVAENEATILKKWQHLHLDGWHWTAGVSWNVVIGSVVHCPTHRTFTDAVRFGLEVESANGDLAAACQVHGAAFESHR